MPGARSHIQDSIHGPPKKKKGGGTLARLCTNARCDTFQIHPATNMARSMGIWYSFVYGTFLIHPVANMV